MYFNKKYKRVGHLFQGTYKAVLVKSEAQLLYLTRYIHKNPISKGVPLRSYFYSSYNDYLGNWNSKWVKPGEILNYFAESGLNSYENFVESNYDYDSTDYVKDLILDEV